MGLFFIATRSKQGGRHRHIVAIACTPECLDRQYEPGRSAVGVLQFAQEEGRRKTVRDVIATGVNAFLVANWSVAGFGGDLSFFRGRCGCFSFRFFTSCGRTFSVVEGS